MTETKSTIPAQFPDNHLDPHGPLELSIYCHMLAQYAVNFEAAVAIEKTRDSWYGIVRHVRKTADAARDLSNL